MKLVAIIALLAFMPSAVSEQQFAATERVRLILEASGLSNKEAYLLLGDAIHEHVSTVCPGSWQED